MRTRLVLHQQIATQFNGLVYIGLTTSFDYGVMVELLEQIDEENDEEDILFYFDHIEGFSLFRILPEGFEHIEGIGTSDTEISQLDLDYDKDYILKITGVDEV